MYSIDNILKTNKLMYKIIFIFSLVFILFFSIIGLKDIINVSSTYNRKVKSNISEYIPTDNNMYKKVYYFDADNRQFSCLDSVVINNKNNQIDKKTIYYNFEDPNVCTTNIIKKTNLIVYIFIILLCIPLLIGLIGMIKINKKLNKIKMLSKCGKLVKNLQYEVVEMKKKNGNILYKAKTKYKFKNQVLILYSESIYDKKLFKEYSKIDLLINENDVNDYYLDFNIQVENK